MDSYHSILLNPPPRSAHRGLLAETNLATSEGLLSQPPPIGYM